MKTGFSMLVTGLVFLIGLGVAPAYSDDSAAFKMCMAQVHDFEFCITWTSADMASPEGDVGPPRPPTRQECGRIWQSCLDHGGIEKAKCDLLKNACNANWKRPAP